LYNAARPDLAGVAQKIPFSGEYLCKSDYCTNNPRTKGGEQEMGKEKESAAQQDNAYSLANVRVGCLDRRKENGLYPQLVRSLNQHADVVAKLPSKLPMLGGIRSGGKIPLSKSTL
jgi:hypothetical protein